MNSQALAVSIPGRALEYIYVLTQTTFASLGLCEPLLRAIQACKFEIPTPIQADSIPPLLANRDLLGVAQTGSGKTAAFTLPILQHLAAQQLRPAPFVARALILAPTRELALQIDETVRALSVHVRLRTVVIIGGASRFKQVEALRRGGRGLRLDEDARAATRRRQPVRARRSRPDARPRLHQGYSPHRRRAAAA